MVDPNEGCLGCTGCLAFIGYVFVAGALGIFATYVAGVLLAVLLVGGLAFFVWAGLQLARERNPRAKVEVVQVRQTTQPTTPASTINPLKGYNNMGNFTPVEDEVSIIRSWEQTEPIPVVPTAQPTSLEDEEFLRFTRAFPVRSIWRSRDRTSNIKIRILSVDHRWTGRASDLVSVIITFEHPASKHRFHWPVKTFNDHWVYDQPANSRARRAGEDIAEVG